MGLLRRHRWFIAAAGFTLVFAVVCLIAPKGPGLTLFGDLWGLVAMLAGLAVCALNVRTRPRQERSFWVLFVAWTPSLDHESNSLDDLGKCPAPSHP